MDTTLKQMASEITYERENMAGKITSAQRAVEAARSAYTPKIRELEAELAILRNQADTASREEQTELDRLITRSRELNRGPRWELLANDLIRLEARGLDILENTGNGIYRPRRDARGNEKLIYRLKVRAVNARPSGAYVRIIAPGVGDLADVRGENLSDTLHNAIQMASQELMRRMRIGH